jgi:hypothetical protein
VRVEEGWEDGIQIKLVLEDAVDAFRQGILVAVVGVGHAWQPPLVGERAEERVATVLAPPVRVMQHAVALAEGDAGLLEGQQRPVMGEIAAEMPATRCGGCTRPW